MMALAATGDRCSLVIQPLRQSFVTRQNETLYHADRSACQAMTDEAQVSCPWLVTAFVHTHSMASWAGHNRAKSL